MNIFLWCLAGYLVLGIGMTVLLEQTTYRDNGWIVTTLLWPLFIWNMMR